MRKYKGTSTDESFIDARLLSCLKKGIKVTVSIDGDMYLISPYKNISISTNPSSDPILREIVEETIAKSHRQWRSIPETAVLVLKAIEDYGVGK